MSACANQEPGSNYIIRDPSFRGMLELRQRSAEQKPGAGSPQQVVIELTPADSVTDRFAIPCLYRGSADAADQETFNRLQDASLSVLSDINFQIGQYRRSDPSSTDFIAWKSLLVENSYVEP